MEQKQLMELDKQYVMNTYSRFGLAIKSGSGSECEGLDGRKYIDFTSGIGVNSLGFCFPQWADAVSSAAHTLQHTSNLFYTVPCVDVARMLCERSGMSGVFFCNSGAEANECAIKAARKYSFMKYGEGRNRIITLVNSFHGRTVTTLAATGQDVFHNYFFPFTGGFSYVEANDLQALENELEKGGVCAVMAELVQGEGGVVALDRDYVKNVSKLCADKDVLFVVDEVQTGIGRTGTLFCFEQYDIKPDIVSMAKGLGGGLPIGAAMFNEKTRSSLTAGDHATTFGGNPVVCSGALCVLEHIDQAFLARVRENAAFMRSRIAAMPHVVGLSGLGMMIGIELDDKADAKTVAAKAIENGVLVLTAKTRLRLLPALNITLEEAQKGLEALKKTLSEI